MKNNRKKVVGAVFLLIILAAMPVVFQQYHAVNLQRAVEETRGRLRAQGFKTDLADFNFATDAQTRSRMAALTLSEGYVAAATPVRTLELLPAVADGSGMVIWKQDSARNPEGNVPWSELKEALDENGPPLDAACEAALGGPIQFDLEASWGSSMRLPHLASLKQLGQMLGVRTAWELQAGHPDAAWTNWLALTRLATSWKVEPAEVSHQIRFELVYLGFQTAWQALQYGPWPEEKLAALQYEWEAADLLTNLPDTIAYRRATTVALCQQDRQESRLAGGISATEIIKTSFHSPSMAFAEIKRSWNAVSYRHYGTFDDEKNLLLFYQQRELEMRRAIAAPTWQQMEGLPGVTNEQVFISPYRHPSRFQSMLNMQSMNAGYRRMFHGDTGLLGRAAMAEAQRRIMVTALALERFRLKHGAYPQGLAELAPDFLKVTPVDFMDGRPLRYRQTADGHFSLYSVGLSGVDTGGKLPAPKSRSTLRGAQNLTALDPDADIVWPVPASSEAAQRQREAEDTARMVEQHHREEAQADEDWKQSPLRQSQIGKIMSIDWASGRLDSGGMTFQGRSLADYLRNDNPSGTNEPTAAELLTPRQVLTGGEPEDLTFEVPVRYEAITNQCSLFLLVDADPDESMNGGTGGKVQELVRAPDGNCRLVWHTIFDPAGDHAVQVQLMAQSDGRGFVSRKSPAIAVTTSNLCQFSFDCAHYVPVLGARFRGRLPEPTGTWSIECTTTNGEHLATLTGSTTNGEFDTVWNLADDHGHRVSGETINTVVHITLPDSGRTQTFRGP